MEAIGRLGEVEEEARLGALIVVLAAMGVALWLLLMLELLVLVLVLVRLLLLLAQLSRGVIESRLVECRGYGRILGFFRHLLVLR